MFYNLVVAFVIVLRFGSSGLDVVFIFGYRYVSLLNCVQ